MHDASHCCCFVQCNAMHTLRYINSAAICCCFDIFARLLRCTNSHTHGASHQCATLYSRRVSNSNLGNYPFLVDLLIFLKKWKSPSLHFDKNKLNFHMVSCVCVCVWTKGHDQSGVFIADWNMFVFCLYLDLLKMMDDRKVRKSEYRNATLWIWFNRS